MKAIVYTQYGAPSVMSVQEVAKPTLQDDQVLVKVRAVSINAADWLFLKGEALLTRLMAGGANKPKKTILGNSIAGTIESVGKNVTTFAVGDAVMGDLSGVGMGGFAEYVAVPANVLVIKPTALTFEQGAAIPLGGVTALQGIRQANIQKGQHVLINGASGGVGSFALQLAKLYGAEVTAVCSTKNIELARSLGADHIIDYTRENFTRNGKRYDIIIGANGQHSIFDYRRALKPNGTYLMTGGTLTQIFQAMLLGPLVSLFGGKKMGNVMGKPDTNDLAQLADMVASGKIQVVIDECYPFEKTSDAMRYFGEVHPRGKVVITV